MCGIVGYIGLNQAQKVLIDGLSKLEYRGYDSAGIAVLDKDNAIKVKKRKGRLKNLEDELEKEALTGTAGIGHTRWATHGEPSDINSHPHCSIDNRIAVVHNGIIENYIELKEELIKKGHLFVSDTDTEVIAHLLNSLYTGDMVETLRLAIDKIKGSYALGICNEEPDRIIAVRKDSPLIVGLGEGENYIASDIPAILRYTRKVYLLDNDEIAILTRDSVTVLDESGREAGKQVFNVDWDPGDAEKGGYDRIITFRFLTATTKPPIAAKDGEWTIYLDDSDCERWLKTLRAVQPAAEAPTADAIVATAKNQVGKEYALNASGPDEFDCSGLVYYVLNECGIAVDHKDCAGYAQNEDWSKIESLSDVKAGDILFFRSANSSDIQHAGIAVSSKNMIDASSSHRKVAERGFQTRYWKEHFAFARRVVE